MNTKDTTVVTLLDSISDKAGHIRSVVSDFHKYIGSVADILKSEVAKTNTHPINALVSKVREFHITFKHPASSFPVMQSLSRAAARAKWIVSETVELTDARDIYDQADAYLDTIYFALGGLVEQGLDAGPLFDIVHTANMAKVWSDGTIHYDENNKVVKPPEWQDPKPLLKAEIDRQIRARISQETV